jgi:preprotein translocase subunit SecG
MIILLTIIHILVCVFLIIVVLLQSGKAADLAGAFGGMGSQTAFGPRGSATLLSKATTVSAVVFMVTSLSLSILATRNAGSSVGSTVLDKTKQSAPVNAPKPGQPVAPASQSSAPAGQPAKAPQTPATAPPAQSPPKK